MKLWRKMATKYRDKETGQIKRNGRELRYTMQLTEMAGKSMRKSTSLFDALMVRAGINYETKLEETLNETE